MERRAFLKASLAGGAALALPRRAHASSPDFAGPIQWHGWDAAVKAAAAQKRMICLVVYADWCPHCHELAPAWKDHEVVKLSHGLVMVHQNVDERPGWLDQRYGKSGHYVPRIFFVRPDGSMIDEITSGNARFPYFYQPQHLDALRSSMARAQAAKVARG